MRRGAADGGRGRRALTLLERVRSALGVAVALASFVAAAAPSSARGQDAPIRLDAGRFTIVCFRGDSALGYSLVTDAARHDTFPGLPRPRQRVLLAIAPDYRTFREWGGTGAPEWGAALAFPESHRILMQGRKAGSDAGDPRATLRHELAHLALHEYLGGLPPRWFDEGYAGYAAGEWQRESALSTNFALALKGMPTLDELEEQFSEGETTAQSAYALAYQAVLNLAQLDPREGLARLFPLWRETRSLDRALRRGYGITLDEFEDRWRRDTRRRYGGLALFGDVTLAGLLVLLVVVPLYLARRRRDRLRLAALRRADDVAEAAERAERARVLAELLGEPVDPATGGRDAEADPMGPSPGQSSDERG